MPVLLEDELLRVLPEIREVPSQEVRILIIFLMHAVLPSYSFGAFFKPLFNTVG